MVNGKTTANGTKVTNPLGTFTMIGGKGVLDTKLTNKVADTAKDFGKGFVNGAVDTALAPVMLVLNAPEVISQMQKNLQTEWQQPNPTDSKGRTTRTAVFLAQARNSQETYSNYSANDWGYFTGEVAVTAAVGAAAAKQAAKPKLGTGEVKGVGKSLSDISPSIRNAFGSDAKITTLTKDTTVYRYYGGDSKASGNWFTPNKVNNPASELALPPGNTAEFVDTVVLPKGTRVIEGTVAPQPQWGQPGGGYQYYVLP